MTKEEITAATNTLHEANSLIKLTEARIKELEAYTYELKEQQNRLARVKAVKQKTIKAIVSYVVECAGE